MLKNAAFSFATACLLLSACSDSDDGEDTAAADGAEAVAADAVPTTVSALLFDVNRDFVGEATVTDINGRLAITLDVSGMAPGAHAAHIHAIGACDPPDFASAGNHWMMDHGNMDMSMDMPMDMAMAMDIGALPDIVLSADGSGSLMAELPDGAEMVSLMDADGASIIVHNGAPGADSAESDDPQAPAACGIFAARD